MASEEGLHPPPPSLEPAKRRNSIRGIASPQLIQKPESPASGQNELLDGPCWLVEEGYGVNVVNKIEGVRNLLGRGSRQDNPLCTR